MKSVLTRVFAVLAATPLLMASPVAAQAPDGHWVTLAPYPQPTQEVGGAVINGSAFGPFGEFQALPTVTLPLFNAGRLRTNVDFNDAATQEAVLRYQQVILQAFREVSDGLFDYRRQ